MLQLVVETGYLSAAYSFQNSKTCWMLDPSQSAGEMRPSLGKPFVLLFKIHFASSAFENLIAEIQLLHEVAAARFSEKPILASLIGKTVREALVFSQF
mgnify:CR=1 FL=1